MVLLYCVSLGLKHIREYLEKFVLFVKFMSEFLLYVEMSNNF